MNNGVAVVMVLNDKQKKTRLVRVIVTLLQKIHYHQMNYFTPVADQRQNILLAELLPFYGHRPNSNVYKLSLRIKHSCL